MLQFYDDPYLEDSAYYDGDYDAPGVAAPADVEEGFFTEEEYAALMAGAPESPPVTEDEINDMAARLAAYKPAGHDHGIPF